MRNDCESRLTADSKEEGEGERLRKEKMRTGKMRRGRVSWLYLGSISPSCAVPPRNDTAVGVHLGSAGQRPEMEPQKVSRLVQRTEVGDVR